MPTKDDMTDCWFGSMAVTSTVVQVTKDCLLLVGCVCGLRPTLVHIFMLLMWSSDKKDVSMNIQHNLIIS